MNELAAVTATNGDTSVETDDENRRQYLEKRDKIWTDDLDDIEGGNTYLNFSAQYFEYIPRVDHRTADIFL